MLGLVGAPLAWGLQFVVIYAFASQLCMVQSPSWLPWLLPAVNLAGLVGAALALRALLLHLRKTRQEHEDQAGSMTDAGEGRTPSSQSGASGSAIVFLLAIAFNTIAVFWRGLCAV